MSSTSPSPTSSPPLPSSPSAPPPQLTPPSPIVTPPPAQPSSTPPMASPPPTSLPPQPSISPPPPVNITPPSSNPPPQPSSPPPTSPPPDPPASSPPPPPPPSSDPPISPPPSISSPPPPSLPEPPTNAPSPPTPRPPESPPPPQPPTDSPPPPSSNLPHTSPPPPQNSPPPSFVPPSNSASPPVPARSPPVSPPTSNSPPRLSPPPSTILSPPPPSNLSPPSLSPPSPSVVPPRNNGTDNSNGNGPESPQSASGGGISTGGTVAIGLVLGLLLLGIFGIAACCVWKRKKKALRLNGGHIMPTSLGSSTESDSGLVKVHISSAPANQSGSSNDIVNSPREPGGLGNSRSWFTHEELVEATNGFSAQNLLGEGGFGCVYKGILKDGRTVAVKQLKIGGGQGEREFKSEVEIIGRIHHRHLVSLVGYCISRDKRLLVYDYVSNDTLYFHLHGEGRPVMNWATRVKIAIGAARGIAYLHEDCHPRIFHRDIKSSNILLDNNFEARVSDFGLAKLAIDTNTHITTRVMGTFGYMAPEYASSGKLTEKSDVYSFGVVLLELITGRKPVDTSRPVGEESLVEWARPLLGHASQAEGFGGLVDPRLQGHYVDGEMIRVIEAAAACVRHSSAKRPKMVQVVRALDSSATADLTNGVRVGESEILNSAELSAEIRLFRRMAFGSQDYSTDLLMQNSLSRR